MRLIGAASILALACALQAQASELPSRKPGLWKVKTSVVNSNAPTRVIKQCIDAATDQMLQSSAGAFSAEACPKRAVSRSSDGMTIDSTCTVGGKPATAHAVVTGSFDDAYTMTVTSKAEEFPGGQLTMTIEAEWLGPCAADQKSGDLIMDNGAKINILEMMKRSGALGNQPPQQ